MLLPSYRHLLARRTCARNFRRARPIMDAQGAYPPRLGTRRRVFRGGVPSPCDSIFLYSLTSLSHSLFGHPYQKIYILQNTYVLCIHFITYFYVCKDWIQCLDILFVSKYNLKKCKDCIVGSSILFRGCRLLSRVDTIQILSGFN